jgi:hypothetical protein
MRHTLSVCHSVKSKHQTTEISLLLSEFQSFTGPRMQDGETLFVFATPCRRKSLLHVKTLSIEIFRSFVSLSTDNGIPVRIILVYIDKTVRESEKKNAKVVQYSSQCVKEPRCNMSTGSRLIEKMRRCVLDDTHPARQDGASKTIFSSERVRINNTRAFASSPRTKRQRQKLP